MAGNQGAEEGGCAMTVEARLRSLLLRFGDPVENGVYHGEADLYYTFNISTQGANYADDMPQAENYLVQIHFYAPRTYNYVKRIGETKLALAKEGFLWPEMTDASDDAGRHIVLETQYVQGVDADGKNDN